MRAGGVAAVAAAKGMPCDEWDVKQDPVGHDLLSQANEDCLMADCATMDYALLLAGIPCTSFTSILCMRGRQLRLRHQPWGRDGLTAEQQRKVRDADELVRVGCSAAVAVVERGGEAIIENVTDRGDPSLLAWWPERAAMCPLVLHPTMVATIECLDLRQLHVPMCRFRPGGPQKWLTLFCTPRAYAVLEPRLRGLRCTHSKEEHGESIGRDEAGVSRAEGTAAYPPAFGWWLTEVPLVCRPPSAGREIGWGAGLHPVMARAVELERHTRPRFASFRKLESMPVAERWAAPMPTPHDVDPEFDPAEAVGSRCSACEEGTDDERPESWPEGATRPPRPNAPPIPGAPPRPIAYHQIWRCVAEEGGRRVGYEMITAWRDKAFAAGEAIARGQPFDDPGTLVVPASLKEPWARTVDLDTRDASDVVLVRASTRHTVFAGRRQCDRAAFRADAEEAGWYDVDPDIMSQAGEGGLESRSAVGRYSVFHWHHRGYVDSFDSLNTTALKELEDQWIIGPYWLPPFEPMRSIPHNVVHQTRLKSDAAGNVWTSEKDRVTTNLTAHQSDSVNGGVSRNNKTVALPTAQTHAAATGITDAIVRKGTQGRYGAGQYSTDLSSAYSFLLMARLCWWLQCVFLVLRRRDGTLVGGFFCRPRLVFGGSFGPNRFGRFSRCKRACTLRRIRQFDADHPLPAGVLAVLKERHALVRAGDLLGGVEQCELGHLQAFLDDETGSTSTDPVSMPPSVNVSDPLSPRYIDIDAFLLATAEEGGRPAPRDARVVAHACLAIDTAMRWALEVAAKTGCGDAIIILGLRVDAEADRLDVPPAKATVMVTELLDLRASATSGAEFLRETVERNVGRLCNASQVDPSVLFRIHAGYTLIHAATRPAGGGPRRRLQTLRLKPTSRLATQFVDMIDNAVASLRAAKGVPLVTAAAFPRRDAPGTGTLVTDASGDDGAGGFAFVAGRPSEVWIVHAAWTPSVGDALSRSATPKAQRALTEPRPVMSMPAGELFTPWAVAEAVRSTGVELKQCVSITDCRPAALALSSGTSKSALMRAILLHARDAVQQWLGVHVSRDFNTDSDLLSHPPTVRKVVAAAKAAGLTVHEIHGFPEHCWLALEQAVRSEPWQ